MFQITIDDVLVVRKNVIISGKCLNKNKFAEILVDENGTEFIARVPFIKYLIPPKLDYITLELKNVKDTKSLLGCVLKSKG